MALTDKDLNKLYFIYDADNEDQQIEISLELLPENISYSYSPNYEAQNLLGRVSPVYMYRNGSAKIYSFSIKIHQDLINEDFVTFIDKIKILSYPKKNIDSTIRLPKVYFQLGELAGFCIVKTSLNWEKPYSITTGHYAMVTISFELTMEREINLPEVRVEQVENTSEIIYDFLVDSDLTGNDAENIIETLNERGYDFAVSDFVTIDGNLILQAKENIAKENYNYQVQRLSKIMDTFGRTNASEKLKDLDILRELRRTSADTLDYTILTTKGDEEAKIIKDAKEQFEKFLDEYYEQNKKLTRQEYNLIYDEVYTVLENLQLLAEEIKGYGASS